MWTRKSNFQINRQTFHIYKPSGWNAILLRNQFTGVRTVFFYSPVYYFKVGIPLIQTQLSFDPNASSFIFHALYFPSLSRLFINQLDLVFSSFYKPVFRKIKFKGKGYYIYKNARNTITPQFGYSHRLYLYSHFVSVRFLNKTTIFLFGLLKTDVIRIGFGIRAMRPINIFTGRGVRFSKEVIYKKVGKVSSYR